MFFCRYIDETPIKKLKMENKLTKIVITDSSTAKEVVDKTTNIKNV